MCGEFLAVALVCFVLWAIEDDTRSHALSVLLPPPLLMLPGLKPQPHLPTVASFR
jgi:hypothetical protein